MEDPSNPDGAACDAAGGDQPNQPRTPRFDVDPDSPFADALSVYTACDRAHFDAMRTTAGLFLDEVIEHLRLLNPRPDEPYAHASFIDTAHRYEVPESDELEGPSNSGASAEAVTDEGESANSDVRTDEAESSNADGPTDASPDEAAVGAAGEAAVSAAGLGGAGLGADSPEPEHLPGFPRFRPDSTFYNWVHMYSHTEDLAEFATVLGATTSRTYSHVTASMILVHGLPQFYQRCLDGEFTIEHVNVATRLCQDVRFALLPNIDDYLAGRRADITPETFAKSLGTRINAIQPEPDRTKTAHEKRRVSITTYPDGTASVSLVGPSADLQAYYLRIEAFAKAIRNGNTACFADQLPEGAVIDDDRAIDALMFDIATCTRPQVRIEVLAEDTETGATTTRQIPLDLEHVRSVDDIDDSIAEAVDTATSIPAGKSTASVGGGTGDGAEDDARAGADGLRADGLPHDGSGRLAESDGIVAEDYELDSGSVVDRDEQGRSRIKVLVSMPTGPYWFGLQAKMITTVPCMTLLGQSDLPGAFSDGSPIPAETARAIAGQCSTWTRILTDPATGTPIDAKAKSYYIPQSVRQTLVTKWQRCTMPGCRRRAESSEVDHIIPYNHDDPATGGLTVFGNLHPLCKKDHQAKTDGKYSVSMDENGVLEYRFPHGIRATVAAGDNPVNIENARLMGDAARLMGDGAQSVSGNVGDAPATDDGAGTFSERGSNTGGDGGSERDSGSHSDAVTPVPEPGDIMFAEECPGPEGSVGSPGWVSAPEISPWLLRCREGEDSDDPTMAHTNSQERNSRNPGPKNPGARKSNPQNSKVRRWVWDNGEPPPF